MTYEYLWDSEDEEHEPENWYRICNNDPTVTRLALSLSPTLTPSFYKNIATALQHNSNITHLDIDGANFIKFIPNDVSDPIFESSKYIETLELSADSYYVYEEKLAIHDDVFSALIKSKKTKITKLIIECDDLMEPLARFLSAANSIKELHLSRRGYYEYNSAAPFIPVLEAIQNGSSLESLHITARPLFPHDYNLKLITSLENFLVNNKTLKKLRLTITTRMDLQDLKKFTMMIQKASSLESFQFYTEIGCSSLKQERDEIKKWFSKISNKFVLNMSHDVLCIEAHGSKKSDPNA